MKAEQTGTKIESCAVRYGGPLIRNIMAAGVWHLSCENFAWGFGSGDVPNAARGPQPNSVLPARGGSLPKGCNKMRPYRSATAPGLGMPFIERQQGLPIDQRLSLGLKQTVFQSPAAVPRSCIRFLQPLGRDPHGQTSSHVAEKLRTKGLSLFHGPLCTKGGRYVL